MVILVKLIGIFIAGMGIILLLSPKTIKRLVAFCQQGKRVYISGLLRLLIGVILLLAASQCRLSGMVATLGILVLIGGILIFVLGIERTKALLNRWSNKSTLFLRLWGILALAIGVLLIYSV